MAASILPGLLQNLVYPAALTTFGLIENAYILEGQIKDVKDDLEGQIREMKGDMKVMKDDVSGLLRHQTDLGTTDMA
ncbi:hypothetical protein MMC24_000061 [Lignoscripta atroalba]|nr:hypothetical protein [Lignoscripta atroalba]